MSRRLVWLACVFALGCGPTPIEPPTDGGSDADGVAGCGVGKASCNGTCIDVSADDSNCGGCGLICSSGTHCVAEACQASKIEHVVLIVQENHSFDAYFGRYCQAAAGSNPTCTSGPNCCERAPDTEPHGASPIVLDDSANFGTDRDHKQACELQEINTGKMDGYVTGSSGSDTCLGFGPSCSSTNNFALADQTTVGAYWTLANSSALADRYFQPIAGGSASNDMYFATTHFQFIDNAYFPLSIASGCVDPNGTCITSARASYTGRTTIADLLLQAGKTFAVYADGYAEARAAAPSCASAPSYCPYSSCIAHPIACHACIYDPSDIPFEYYATLVDSAHMRDYADLQTDVTAGTLPSFSYVKAREYRNEHPNVSTISDGISFVTSTLNTLSVTPYVDNTLVLLTWDEGGGFFDHVSPPPGIDKDDSGATVPYGTRVPLVAIGKFARTGNVSHVQMEHSSIVRFLEYNFIGPVGQLGFNDAKVNNIGSLLDPAQTGIPIP